MKKLLFGALLLVSSLGCAMPATTVRTIDDRPSLIIKGAPPDAVLFVDGLNMGLAIQYADDTALTVEPGTHVVSVVSNGTTIFEQKVFVEGSIKTISVR